MRKALIVAGVWFVGMAGWLTGSAVGGTAVIADPYARATSFDHAGWSFHCDTPGSCPIPLVLVEPWVTFDSLGATYNAVVTASFTYRTTADVRIRVSPSIVAPGPTGVQVPWAGRELDAAPKPRSVTLTWVAEGLEGGTAYDVGVWASVTRTPATAYDISVSDLTIVVEGTPV